MPVPVANQGIHNEHVPEVAFQHDRIENLLLRNSLHDVRQLSAVAVSLRINDGILQRREVLQNGAIGREIPAGNDHPLTSILRVHTQQRILRGNARHLKDVRAQIFRYAAVGIAYVLVPRGRCRELEHVLCSLIDNGNFVAVRACVGFVAPRKAGEINHSAPPFAGILFSGEQPAPA